MNKSESNQELLIKRSIFIAFQAAIRSIQIGDVEGSYKYTLEAVRKSRVLGGQ